MGDNLDGLRKYLEKYASLAENRKRSIDTVGDEFTEIRNISAELKKALSVSEGAKEINKRKNRYKDILPYDKTRVKLDVSSSSDGSDYINANFIKDFNNKRCYIASQGPMPHTVNDFWRMIWSYNSKVIIMACKEIELGKPRCHRYWPIEMGDEDTFGDIAVNLQCETKVAQNMMLRELVVTKKNSAKRKICQLHFMDWPDHGAPETYEAIVHLLKLARNRQPTDDVPILVHCSAGCGRTGAIIAIDYAKKMIAQRVNEISVLDIVKHLREQRPAMVQTKEQYEFIYEVIRELVATELKECDEDYKNWSPDATYENIQFVFKDKESPVNKVREAANRSMAKSQSVEEGLSARREWQQQLQQQQQQQQNNQQRKQIILPTEHSVNTSNFRRSRSQHSRHAATSTSSSSSSSRPPLPRKGSEYSAGPPSPTTPGTPSNNQSGNFNRPNYVNTNPQKVGATDYENITAHPPPYINNQDEPLSPFANEEFIPHAMPVGLNSYPMKTQLLTVSHVEHKHNAIKQARSHELLTQNTSNPIPRGTLLNVANEKLKKFNSADDLLSDRYERPAEKNMSPFDGLYTAVDKAARDARVINKPRAPPSLSSSEKNRSSVKKGIQEDTKRKVERTNSDTNWMLSIQSTPSPTSSSSGNRGNDVPPLPERTPESDIILGTDTSDSNQPVHHQQQQQDTEQQQEYTPISSIAHPNAYKNIISQAPSPDKPSNWNPLSKMFGRSKISEDKNSFTVYANAESDQKNHQTSSQNSNNHHIGYGIRLKKKPKGPREIPPKFR